MKRLGIIDIGSNSLRLVIAEIDTSGSYRIIDDLKETVRLGADMLDDNSLNAERIDKAIVAIKTFINFSYSLSVNEIIAVATEAVRKASNKEYFIDRIYDEVGINIRLLSGYEEAYYDTFAVVNSMYVDNALVIDIGGSSTELAWIKNNQMVECTTFSYGAVNLTQLYNTDDIITTSDEESLRKFILGMFKNIPWISKGRFSKIIGIGGSIRNIGKINRKLRRYSLDIHHNYELLVEDVHIVYNSIKSKNLKQRKKIDGLSPDRADIITAPVCIVYSLMDYLEIEHLVISGKGLRDGLLYEYICNNYKPIEDVLDYSIKNIMHNHNINFNHACNVYNLVMILFENLKPLHNLEDFNKIIKTAAYLHDAGLSIRYYDHHKHSFYMIINSELNGLSHKELIMSAYIAASHRNRDLDLNIFQFHDIVSKLDMIKIEKIGALLRIAEALDKSMTRNVKNIICSIEKDTVTLKIISSQNIDVEIREVKKSSEYFRLAYNKELVII
jgi:exopolyphosphatase / guanosine-5'-triphosphate,3'-diphosphate pyrophosphatase